MKAFRRNVKVTPPPQGNALVEYLFIAALVAVVCIAGFLAFGKNFQNTLAGLKQDMQKNSQASSLAQAHQNAGSASGARPSSSIPQQKVCFNKTLCVNYPVIDNSAQSLITAGANGSEVTSQLASVYDQLAAHLKKDPKTDPALLNLVTQLANQGHSIADAENQLTSYIGSTGYQIALTQANLYYAAQVKNDFTAMTNQITGSQTTFNATQQALQDYLATHPTALPGGSQILIGLSSQNIQIISQHSTNNAMAIANNMVNATMLAGSDSVNLSLAGMERLPPLSAAPLTEVNSNVICANGGSQCVKHNYSQ